MAEAAEHGAASAPTLSVRLRAPDTLTADDIAAWDGLYDRSADTNLFAHPAVVRAGLSHCGGEAARLAWVSTAGGALIAVVPLAPAGRLGRAAIPHVRLWSHPNSFCATPLIRAGQEAAVWPALLTALPDDPHLTGGRMLLLPTVAADSQLSAGLKAAAAELALPMRLIDHHERAVADGRAAGLTDYWERYVRPKKRKEVRRQWARLHECGAVIVDVLAPGADARPWIAEFLALERSGWKGAAGSALAAAAGTATFFSQVVADAQQRGQLCFTAIRLDGRAVAMLVTLIDGPAGFSFKTAYDETLARFSPGVLIQRESLPILAARGVSWIDSCAAPDHPMIDSLWGERRAIETLLMPSPGVANRLNFALYEAAMKGWRLAKALRRRQG